jgi:hypothetical protein
MRTLILLLLLSTSAFGQNTEIMLGWNPNREPDLAGYKLLIGTQPGVFDREFEGTAVTRTVSLPIGVMHYACVIAINTSGVASEPSNELAFQAYRPGEAKPPSQPTGLRRTDIAVTLQSSPDLRIWSDQATHRYAVVGDRHFWRLHISK